MTSTSGGRTPEPSPARKLARWVKHLPARRLHARRREAATATLAALPPSASVLFICHGNICRSPYAELKMRALVGARGADIPTTSAGFIEGGRSSPDDAQTAGAERGVDLSTHRSRPLTQALVDAHDVLVVMEPGQRSLLFGRFPVRGSPVIILGDLDPEPIRHRMIRDPVELPLDVYRDVYDRIDRCLGRLFDTVSNAGKA